MGFGSFMDTLTLDLFDFDDSKSAPGEAAMSAANTQAASQTEALNYLKATDLKLAIILNLGKEQLEYERIVI